MTRLLLVTGLAAFAGLSSGCAPATPMQTPDTAMGLDAFAIHTGPCTTDPECAPTYCNPGSHLCCIPASPAYEICGDRIDQNCDRHDESCGDNDRDGIQACMAGQDPLSGCDCDDEHDTVRPPLGMVAGAREICDGIDNDCNGRIDESAACCAGCASLGADRATRADICTAAGECDCAGEPGTGPCATGMHCCTGGCVDTTTDLANCGLCGAACSVSSDRCVVGECRCGTGLPCDLVGVCTAGMCG